MAVARCLIGAWLLLALAQWLVAAREFASDGALPPARLARLSKRRWLAAARSRVSPPALRLLFGFQIASTIALLAFGDPGVTIACLALLIACQAGFVLLCGHFWVDGSDKIGLIVMAGTLLTAAGVVAEDPGLAMAGILLTGGQLVLSYLAAGISKLAASGWRSGETLTAIMATQAWGDKRVSALLRFPLLAWGASWAVILAEALFPLALLASAPWLIGAMAALFLFHLATAVFMGLNKFPWAFLAAYPAVFLLSRALRTALGLEG